MSDRPPDYKWTPDTLDEARRRRMLNDRGQYPNCRHYNKTGERSFICAKYGPKTTCNECPTCPNCGGMKFLYDREITKSMHYVHIRNGYSCAICGAWIDEEYILVTEKQPHRKAWGEAQCCQVAGCTNRAYEGHKHEENGFQYIICETHHRRVKTWRLHPGKNEHHHPIVILHGKLFDNPDYRKKQEKKSNGSED